MCLLTVGLFGGCFRFMWKYCVYQVFVFCISVCFDVDENIARKTLLDEKKRIVLEKVFYLLKLHKLICSLLNTEVSSICY